MEFILSFLARTVILYALYLIVFILLLNEQANDKIFFGFMLIVVIFDFLISFAMNIKARRGKQNGRDRI